MKQFLSELMCRIFGHKYESIVELDRKRSKVSALLRCARCGDRRPLDPRYMR